jgi:glycosyltransferase involved in cell wall biosynthesis
MRISVGVPTKNRYEVLSHTLLSIAFQSLRPIEIIIVDDSDNPIDLTTISHYEYVLRLFEEHGISWFVIFGKKQGQHHSHQLIQEIAKGDFIFRCDDDCVVEPDCLKILAENMSDNVGAVAPLVLMPNASELPKGLTNDINDLTKPNVQWFKQKENTIQHAEHLYSCFLYRKGIANYPLSLSCKSHREESIHSHSIKRAGYSLLIASEAKVWHWRCAVGGIRSDNNIQDYEHDEKIFQSYLKLWGVNNNGNAIFIINNGIGDHYCFKNIIPKLKEKHNNITIACCYPEIFFDEENLKLISIAEAKLLCGDIEAFSIYIWMEQNNWKGTLSKAFERMYLCA